ncbi:MAG: hypothetical protein VR64_10615 [Desulfatitalea sp. BRH_c12]|nr:MAG: hypothetical protein VR64_10615 [Desulfatitalea sp. BRH_c12]
MLRYFIGVIAVTWLSGCAWWGQDVPDYTLLRQAERAEARISDYALANNPDGDDVAIGLDRSDLSMGPNGTTKIFRLRDLPASDQVAGALATKQAALPGVTSDGADGIDVAGGANFAGPVAIDNTDVRKSLYRLSSGGSQPVLPSSSFVDPIALSDWAVYSTIGADETTLVRCGTGAARYSNASAGNRGAVRTYGTGAEYDFSGMTLFMRYYIDPAMSPNMTYTNSYIIFYADSGTDNRWTMGNLPQAAGWNEISFTPSMGLFTGTMADWSAVERVLVIHDFPTGGGYFVLDEFSGWAHGRTKGAVIFQFDDGVQSSYTEGIRYLAKYGFPSVFYISPDYVVEVGETRLSTAYGDFCNWEEIWAAQTCGALIATHAQSSLPVSTKAELREWIVTHKAMLVERGYGIGADYFAIPQGQGAAFDGAALSEQEIIDTLREYFLHIRGTHPWWQNASRGATYCGSANNQPYLQRDNRWGWGYAATNATAQTKIDEAIANKDVAALYFHNLTTGTNPTIAQFRAIVDYVKTQVDAGTLEVITYENLMQQ